MEEEKRRREQVIVLAQPEPAAVRGWEHSAVP